MLSWKPKYSLSIESIDQQHEELFRIIHDLYDAVTEGRAKTAISEVLDRLVKYTGSHFELEERLMTDSGYLAVAEHTAEHRKFTQRVLELQNDFCKGRQGLTLEVLLTVVEWWDSHIGNTDCRYGPVVRSHLAGLQKPAR